MKINANAIVIKTNSLTIPKQTNNDLHKDLNTKKSMVNALEKQGLVEDKVEQVKAALETFNEIIKTTHLEFKMHEDAGRYFVKIVNDQTQEVIKQIPSENFLKMIAEAKEQLGLLIDKKV